MKFPNMSQTYTVQVAAVGAEEDLVVVDPAEVVGVADALAQKSKKR